MIRFIVSFLFLCGVFAASAPSPASADEGMWLLNHPPLERIADDYGLDLSPQFFEHLQKSALRYGHGASASFVSPRGLILTNHHVARGQAAKLSTPERDLVADGFLATTLAEELPCPDLAVYSLQEIVDVTERVKAAGRRGLGVDGAETNRRAEIAAIEAESEAETGLQSEVITLYGGGLYHLYRYRRYDDVRLVFLPRPSVAAFGGDVDNFEFPRWCLDVAFLRAYDADGRPAHPDDYLKVSRGGVSDGDPVFTVGNPRATHRLNTADHLRFIRDVQYPSDMLQARTREVELLVFSSRGPREAALAAPSLTGTQNWRKGTGSKLRDLEDPRIFALKVEQETRLREAVAFDPDLAERVGDPWARASEALGTARDIYDEYTTLENSRMHRLFGGSDLFRIARIIVRLVEERGKPDAERLAEYRESNMDQVERTLYSPAPIVPELEESVLESRIALAAEVLGGEHPVVRALLGGLRPRDRAQALVNGSHLADVDVRRALVAGGPEAVEASTDPMIELVRELEPQARSVREVYENAVEAVLRDAYARLAEARFAVYGDGIYPDATASLRLGMGRVAGYEQEGVEVGPFTTLGGLYRSAEERGPLPPFDLDPQWAAARDRLDPETPFDFTCTNDIIGGSSGSPMVNGKGECVGVVFDGNRYSFVWDFIYTADRARAVAVDMRAILEALREVYGADRLVNEMLGL